MRFHVVNFRVMRFRAPPAPAPAPADADSSAVAASDVTAPLPELVGREWDIGHPTAESQRAGLDHLLRIAMEQAAAGHGGDGTTGAYRHS
jgi:hypothetical protein